MFYPHFFRENILKTAKALVEDTKLLVSGAASTPDKLAQAAQSSAATITQLAEVVKLGAASLGADDPETQVTMGLAEGGGSCHPMHGATDERALGRYTKSIYALGMGRGQFCR